MTALRLDVPSLNDVEPIHRIYSDPRVWGHLPSGCHTSVDQTEEMVLGWIRGWERDGLSSWIVREAGTDEVLGACGCWTKAGVFWNLGYRFAYDAHGRGLATEASREAVAAAVRIRPDLPVVAFLLEHNLASARVAEKAGLTLRHRGPDAGNLDPEAVRVIYADRELTAEQVDATLG